MTNTALQYFKGAEAGCSEGPGGDPAMGAGLKGGSMTIGAGMGAGDRSTAMYWEHSDIVEGAAQGLPSSAVLPNSANLALSTANESDSGLSTVAGGAPRSDSLCAFSTATEGGNSCQSSDTPMAACAEFLIPEKKLRPRHQPGGPVASALQVNAVADPQGRGMEAAGLRERRAQGKSPKKTSRYNGVSKHKRSGRWEAHIWVNDYGRQIYLGGFDVPEDAAAAYDMIAIKSKGLTASTNFDVKRYLPLWSWLQGVTLPELVTCLRRRSKGFSRGSSKYRGVTRHPTGRWESRIGVHGSRHIYLGLYLHEETAAKHYDRALVRLRGVGAATNFSQSDYVKEMAEYEWMRK
ncbi:unnamed protein product, partial [Ostreobium quekettii]